jgi:hypothetical protein
MWFIGALQVNSTGILTEGVPHRNRVKRGENNDLQKECSPISLLITLRYEVTKHLKSALQLASSNNANASYRRIYGVMSGSCILLDSAQSIELGRLASH